LKNQNSHCIKASNNKRDNQMQLIYHSHEGSAVYTPSFSGRCFPAVRHCCRTSRQRRHWLLKKRRKAYLFNRPPPQSSAVVPAASTVACHFGHYNCSFYLLTYLLTHGYEAPTAACW